MYGWTPDQCDEQELDVFFDLLIIANKVPQKTTEEEPAAYQKDSSASVYVDQVFF